MMNGWSELPRRYGSERIAFEVDLRAYARLVVDIEQEVADCAPLDRCDKPGDGLGIASRDRATFRGIQVADAAELARMIFTREREHAGPRRAFFLKDDQRA